MPRLPTRCEIHLAAKADVFDHRLDQGELYSRRDPCGEHQSAGLNAAANVDEETRIGPSGRLTGMVIAKPGASWGPRRAVASADCTRVPTALHGASTAAPAVRRETERVFCCVDPFSLGAV